MNEDSFNYYKKDINETIDVITSYRKSLNDSKFFYDDDGKKSIDEGIKTLEKILFFFNLSKNFFKEQKLSKEYYEKMINDNYNAKKIKEYKLDNFFKPYDIFLFENLDENSIDKEKIFEKLCIKTFCNEGKEWKNKCYHKNARKFHPDKTNNDLIKQEMFKHLSNCNGKLTEKENSKKDEEKSKEENEIVSKTHIIIKEQIRQILKNPEKKIDKQNNQLIISKNITDHKLEKIHSFQKDVLNLIDSNSIKEL